MEHANSAAAAALGAVEAIATAEEDIFVGFSVPGLLASRFFGFPVCWISFRLILAKLAVNFITLHA